jgi:photosystem II stability/assembly factor-like uncharacterized protein
LDENNGYAAGGNWDGGVIIKTTNGGNDWIDITPSFAISRCFSLSFVDSLSGWISSGSGSDNGMILKTIDGGNNWIVQREIFGMYFNAIHSKDNFEVWAAGYDPSFETNMIYTSDGGVNWIDKQLYNGILHDLIFFDENFGWAISLKEVFYTENGGVSWDKQTLYSTQNLNSINFISAEDGWIVGYWGTMFHTTNGGVSHIAEHNQQIDFPNDISLFQNYPNPFNSNTNIKFYIYSPSFLVLEIINPIGQNITTLFQGDLNRGEYLFNWDG